MPHGSEPENRKDHSKTAGQSLADGDALHEPREAVRDVEEELLRVFDHA